jgi:hypothetical protein
MKVLLNKFFGKCAPSGGDCRSGGYLVRGDKAHLLTLNEAAGVPIIAVSDFLRLLGVPENPT